MITKHLLVITLVASLAILAGAYAPRSADAAPADVIESFVEALNNGDGEGAAAVFAEDAVFTDIDGGSFAVVGRPALEFIFTDAATVNVNVELSNVQTNADQVTGVGRVSDDDSDAAGVDRYVQPFTATVENDLITEFHLTYDTSDTQTRTYLEYIESQDEGDDTLPPGAVTITLGPGRDGSQTGDAFIFEEDGLAFVGIEIAAGTPGVLQPAHVHDGDCPGVGAIAFPLASVLDGFSFTILSATQAELLAGDFAINIHQSVPQIGLYTACGEVVAAGAAPTPQPSGSPGPAATPTRATGVTAPDTGAGSSGDGASGWALAAVIAAGALALAGGSALRLRSRVG